MDWMGKMGYGILAPSSSSPTLIFYTEVPQRPIKGPSSLTVIPTCRSAREEAVASTVGQRLGPVVPAVDGQVFLPRQRRRPSTVSIFWDLDNKPPPQVAPFEAANNLRDTAARFGTVVDLVAFANHHAFSHIPGWVRQERRERKQLDFLEATGASIPDSPYTCDLCGRRCKTNLDLKKHFKQLHVRERQKRMSRLSSLRGKRRLKYRQSMSAREDRFSQASKGLVVPRVGYGLAQELRRAGVYVRTVEDKPQAADQALKRQIAHAITRNIGCICLVSDDSGFSDALRAARSRDLKTVVVGDSRSLKRHADLWLSWEDVAKGNARHTSLEASHQWRAEDELIKELIHDLRDDEDDDDYNDDYRLLPEMSPAPAVKTSAFSDAEEEDEDESETDGAAFYDIDDPEFWIDSDEDMETEYDKEE